MAEVVGIRFKEVGKVYYVDPDGKTFEKGDRAIVETARGVECGEVTMGNSVVDDSEIVKPLKSVIRAATKADLERVRARAAGPVRPGAVGRHLQRPAVCPDSAAQPSDAPRAHHCCQQYSQRAVHGGIGADRSRTAGCRPECAAAVSVHGAGQCCGTGTDVLAGATVCSSQYLLAAAQPEAAKFQADIMATFH